MKISNALVKGNNFNFMRLFAAFSVMFGHSFILSKGNKFPEDPISILLIKYFGE